MDVTSIEYTCVFSSAVPATRSLLHGYPKGVEGEAEVDGAEVVVEEGAVGEAKKLLKPLRAMRKLKTLHLLKNLQKSLSLSQRLRRKLGHHQIPCKHVFCLACGKKEQKQCPRCLEKVSRVEQTGLGTVFMCTHGGSRYGTTGCRRTYLSQRDLQAHINHRHVSSNMQTQPAAPAPQPMEVIVAETERTAMRPKPNLINDPRSNPVQTGGRRASQMQTSGVRTNLITVPIQETAPVVHETIPTSQNYYTQYQPASTLTTNYGQTLPPMHIPPPQPQPQYYTTPPAYSPAAPTYSAYPTAPTAATQAAYVTPTVAAPPRVAQQYDYNAATTQWTNSQQYYR